MHRIFQKPVSTFWSDALANLNRLNGVVEVAKRAGAGRIGAAVTEIAFIADANFQAIGIVDGRNAIGPFTKTANRFPFLHAEAAATEAAAIIKAGLAGAGLDNRRTRTGTAIARII